MLSRIRIIFLSAICLFSVSVIGLAQLPGNSYSISFLTAKDGISQGTSRYMLQDSKGYMWLSSIDGINRYNGKEFFHFKAPRYYEDCKPVTQVWGLVEDANTDVWMGSMQGLYRYQRGRNTFVKYDIFTPLQGTGVVNMPFAIVGTEVWVTDGLFSFKAIDFNTQKVRVLYEASVNLQPAQACVTPPQYDGKGNIWVANENAIHRISIQDSAVVTFPVFNLQSKSTGGITVTGFALHMQAHVLAISTTKGLVLFDIQQKQNIPLKDENKLLSKQEAWYVKADNGCFLVANEECPLIKVALNGETIIPLIEKKILDNEEHRGSRTACMYRDQWNRLWLNANGEYTAVIDFNERFIKKIVRGGVSGLPSGTVLSIRNVGNEIWVSDTYLSVIDRITGKVEKRFSTAVLPGLPVSFEQLFYDSLLQRMWISAGSHIYYYDLKADRFVKTGFVFPGTGIDWLRCFAKLRSGELLLVGKDGVWQADRDGNKALFIPGFGKGIINDLFVQNNGRLVLSVIGEPLKIVEYSAEAGFKLIKSVALPGIPMMVSEDAINNVIWVATDRGIYKIDNLSYKVLQHYSESDGMANEFTYAVLPDKYGWIWCSTNKGIVAINTRTNEVVNYDMNQNLQELEFNNRAYHADSEGYIYFGGVKGMNYFKPPVKDYDTIQPKIIIEDILLNNIPYAPFLNPDMINDIHYLYGKGSLTIKVQALHLIKANNLRITYRLREQKQDWIAIKNGESIQMFNLAPGNYHLEISYTDGSSKHTIASRVLHIQVKPPWYLAWWFRWLLVLSLISLVWFVIARRQKRKLRKLQQENEIMRLKVEKETSIARERERIITDLHDDIGATLSSMHIYGDLAKNMWDTQPDDSKKMIDRITGTSKDLMSRMGDIIWSMKPADEEKFTLEARLTNYCNELLAPKNIVVTFDIDRDLAASITNPEVRKNILLIAKEALNNIAKYSGASMASVSIKKVNAVLELTISDNGKGFDIGATGQGNGLGNIKSRCAMLNGNCEIESESGQGVVVSCIFPIAIISHKV